MTNANAIQNGSEPRVEQIETIEYFDADEPDELAPALTNEQIRRNPHRDPDELADAWEQEGTVAGVADELDCSKSAASKWLHAYMIRPKNSGNRPQFVIDAMTAERGESA